MTRLRNRDDLLRELPSASIGAELGVFLGEFASRILSVAQPKLLYLVDLWHETLERKEQDNAAKWHVVRHTGRDALLTVQEKFSDYLRSGHVQLVCTEACRWLEQQPVASLDWVYLDDDHRREHVARELKAAARCVRPGGWIMGHDYCDVLPGVVQAVNDFCVRNQLTIQFLTEDGPLPVHPREDWMPETCSYKSFAIRLPE